MTAVVFNVEGDEGGTVTVRVQVKEADGTDSVLAGYTGKMQVRPDPLSATILASGTVTISGATVTGTIAAADTTTWSSGFYDIKITSPTNTVEYIARGQIKLEPSITQG